MIVVDATTKCNKNKIQHQQDLVKTVDWASWLCMLPTSQSAQLARKTQQRGVYVVFCVCANCELCVSANCAL